MNMAIAGKLYLKPEAVIGAFAAHHQVSDTVLLQGQSQTRTITALRHQLIWLLNDLTEASQDMIGRLMNRDQSTVWEAIGKVSDQLATDPELRRSLRELREKIVQSALCPPMVAVDARATGARVVAAASVLRDQTLSDAEARAAALAILSNIMEIPRG